MAQRPVDAAHRGRPDICLIEVGGTVGDIESSCYLEALQQFYTKTGEQNFCLVSFFAFPPPAESGFESSPVVISVMLLTFPSLDREQIGSRRRNLRSTALK